MNQPIKLLMGKVMLFARRQHLITLIILMYVMFTRIFLKHLPGPLIELRTGILVLNMEWNRIAFHVSIVCSRHNTTKTNSNEIYTFELFTIHLLVWEIG